MTSLIVIMATFIPGMFILLQGTELNDDRTPSDATLMASGVPWLVGCVTPVSAFIFASVSQISLTLSLKGHLPFDL